MGGYVGIPTSYTPVEYIESTGTQYIDTGFLPNSNTSVILEAKIPSSRSSNITRFFESRNEASSVTGAFGVISFNDNNKLLQIRYDASTNLSNGQLTTDVKHKISMQKNQLYIDDVLKITASTATFQTNYSLLIFGFHTPSAKQNAEGVYLLYSFKIYDNGTLVRDYIPVIDQDNVACLYDLVEDKFYYNAGTGTFLAGSTTGSPVVIGDKARRIVEAYVGVNNIAREIIKGYVGVGGVARRIFEYFTPLNYIGSDGNQWIDTGVVYDYATTQFDIDFQYLSSDNAGYISVSWSGSSHDAYVLGSSGTSSNGSIVCGTPQGGSWTSIKTKDANRHKYTYNNAWHQIIYDGGVISGKTTVNVNGVVTMRIFRAPGSNNPAKARIYSYRISNIVTGELIRDFIPVLDLDGVPCLFDKVTEAYFYNQGSGTFLYG